MRIGGHGLDVGRQQVGVGLAVGPAHPSPKLVELGQAEAVRALDDDGVRVGDIDARLDDGAA